MSTPIFVKDAGASVASRNVLTGAGRLRWLERRASRDPADNGWRFLSDADSDEFLSDPSNLEIVDYNRVCAIEPAIIPLLDWPVGSRLRIDRTPLGALSIVDESTGRTLTREQLYGDAPR